jgi:hypothetical protein
VPSCAGPRVPPVRPARSRSGSTTQVDGPSRSPAQHSTRIRGRTSDPGH